MFKSLLRTLPSLSGNFTIACKLNEIKKTDFETYYAYARVADLMPLQNNIYKNSIELNLLNGKYEHDIKKYYSKYSNFFYKENYSYNKENYKTLDINSLYNEANDNRNKDYEYGCKRIYYSRTGYQFSFYAPFYLDDINDLPEYFCIHIKIGNTKKNIKIYLNKEYKTNYLYKYLVSYFENVDSKVIFCLPETSQATYFGVDVKNGGFAQYKDNMFGYLYSNQIMINNFDKLICQGFERNNIIMKQIIPLSFIFNVNDIFSEYERKFFMGYPMTIYGYYYNGKTKLDMFDFDINYTKSYDKYNKYNKQSAKYEYSNGYNNISLINVMDVGYPALNESKYIKYMFENKLSPNYCKFKMLLSDDNDPYIINNNFAYSYLQYPNQKYGYFPTMLKGITPKLICIDGDIKLPIGNNIEGYYTISTYNANTIITDNINYNKFLKLMQNYVATWFTYYKINDINDIIDLCKNDIWSNVVFGYSYFHGILYDLKKLEKYNIDKFSVILNCNILKNEDSEKYAKGKYIYSKTDKSYINTYKFNDTYRMIQYNSSLGITYYNKFFMNNSINNSAYLHYDKLLVKNFYGKYIKEEHYKDELQFIKLNDIINLINNSYFPNSIKTKIIEYLQIEKTLGYLILDGYHNINYFEKKYDINNNEYFQFMLSDSLFNTNNKSKQYEWLYNKLYYSTHISSNKEKISKNYSNISYNEDINGKIVVYLEIDFIDIYNIYYILNKTFNNNDDINIIYNSIDESFVINTQLEYKEIYDLKNKYESIDMTTINQIEQKKNYVINLSMLLFGYNIFGNLIDFNSIEFNNKYSNELIPKYNETYIAYKEKSIKSIYNNFINVICNIDKYMFNSYSKINGIEITNYFSKITNNNEKNIYVDSYNLNNLINLYNSKNKSSLTLTDSLKKEYYIMFLNKTHIKEYYLKLNNDENNISTIELISNSYKNVLDCLYVKERYWVINSDSVEVKDVYTTLYNYILKYLVSYEYITYENSKTIYDENTIYDINMIYSYFISNDSDLIYDFIINNLSENRNSKNKFELKIGNIVFELDLCFKKNVYLLNETIFKLLYENNEITNYLYLYIEDSCLNENNDVWNIIDNNYISKYNNSNNNYLELNIDTKLYQKNINEYLVPLFNNIYVDDSNKNIIYNMIQKNKIYNCKYILNEDNYFKEIDIFDTLYSIYSDKTYFINNAYDTYEQSNKLSLNEKIEYFIKNDISTLYNILINNFTNLSNNIISENLVIDYFNNYKDEYLSTLVQAVSSIVTNSIKIYELDNYLTSNSLMSIFNNEYMIENNIGNDISINNMIYHKLLFLKEYNDYHLYNLLKMNDITLYSLSDDLSIGLNSFNDDNVKYDESNNIYIYDNDGVTYAFYYINVNVDNSNYSFNILNDYNLNIMFNTINGNNITNKSFIKNIFYILYPFLTINVFEEYSKKISTIVYQNELDVLIKYMASNYLYEHDKYKYINYIDSLDDSLYCSLVEFQKYKKIKILRYFNYITPLIKKIDNIIYDYWTIRFMEYNYKYDNIKKYNILDIENINIYNYKPLTVYNESYNEDTLNNKYQFTNSYTISQIEYKHFNDNFMYNLPEQIILYDNNIYGEELISNITNNSDYLYNTKVNILYNFFKENGFNYDNMKLFLFNKYDSSFFIEKNSNKYKIKYIFNLI